MRPRAHRTILSTVAPDVFVGRIDELERLYLDAVAAGRTQLSMVGAPGVGTSEVLRQLFDRLFLEQRFVVPFYFSVRASDEDAHAAAARFTYQFLLQAIAFRRNEPDLIAAAPDVCELARLAPMSDAEWVDRLSAVCKNEGPLNDGRAFIRSALAAPLRAADAAKMRIAIIADDLHDAAALDGGRNFIDEMFAAFLNSSFPFFAGSRRRFRRRHGEIEKRELSPLDRSGSIALAASLAARLDIDISEQARDLVAEMFGGVPKFIHYFLLAARERRRPLNAFRDVAALYADEIVDGRLGLYYGTLLNDPNGNGPIGDHVYESLHSSAGRPFQISTLVERVGGDRAIIERLAVAEVIDTVDGTARVSSTRLVRDVIEARAGVASKTAVAAASSLVTRTLKRAPRLMAEVYRREASLGLRDLLLAFDLQDVPRVLLDHRPFRERFKGLSDAEMRARFSEETDMFLLPQLAHAEPIVEHLPGFGGAVEPERAVLAVGFNDRGYREEDETAWLAVEIDSKLEADHPLALEWCDLLDDAAEKLGLRNYRIWLIAPEGFTDGALELLAERGGIGSNRRQAEMLRAYLRGRDEAESVAVEYEIVIPIGEDTELIAAHALEEIAHRYDYPAKTVNQLKTALVEACINASEHSLSPDRKIYQKFSIDREKIVITVSNRGLRLVDKRPQPEVPTEGRRGWGINLIKGLMDEVRIESVDDGTRITMTKYVPVANEPPR